MEKFIDGVSEGKWASGLAKSDAQFVLEQMLMYIRAGIEQLHQGNLGPHDLRGGLLVNHRRRCRLIDVFLQAGQNYTVRKITFKTWQNRLR